MWYCFSCDFLRLRLQRLESYLNTAVDGRAGVGPVQVHLFCPGIGHKTVNIIYQFPVFHQRRAPASWGYSQQPNFLEENNNDYTMLFVCNLPADSYSFAYRGEKNWELLFFQTLKLVQYLFQEDKLIFRIVFVWVFDN